MTVTSLKLKSTIFPLAIFLSAAFLMPAYGSSLLTDEKSFAEKYRGLRILLQQVKTKEDAESLKPAIEEEISILSANQASGSAHFKSLSSEEKKLFIKKYQRNQFHCGEVTAVMNERRRIMLHPTLSGILRDTLNTIP